MSKIIEQIKKTTVEYTTKAIEGINLVKWYCNKTEIIDGVSKTERFCGICDVETFDAHNSVEPISNKISIQEFYQKQVEHLKKTQATVGHIHIHTPMET